MPRFLSDEWIDALDQAISGPGGPRIPDGELVVQHVVTGSRDEQAYHLVIGVGSARAHRGRAEGPTVTFTARYDTAAAIAAGRASAQAAFMAGELRLGGQVDQLLAHHGALAETDDVLAELRATTEY